MNDPLLARAKMETSGQQSMVTTPVKPESYHAYSLHSALRLRLTFAAQIGNESGKAGEVLKLAAVFPTADNEF